MYIYIPSLAIITSLVKWYVSGVNCMYGNRYKLLIHLI